MWIELANRVVICLGNSSFLQAADSSAEVTAIKKAQKDAPAPAALNTVELLRGASLKLGVSPARCMQIAEGLYMAGYISYPRTESSRWLSLSLCLSVSMSHCVSHCVCLTVSLTVCVSL